MAFLPFLIALSLSICSGAPSGPSWRHNTGPNGPPYTSVAIGKDASIVAATAGLQRGPYLTQVFDLESGDRYLSSKLANSSSGATALALSQNATSSVQGVSGVSDQIEGSVTLQGFSFNNSVWTKHVPGLLPLSQTFLAIDKNASLLAFVGYYPLDDDFKLEIIEPQAGKVLMSEIVPTAGAVGDGSVKMSRDGSTVIISAGNDLYLYDTLRYSWSHLGSVLPPYRLPISWDISHDGVYVLVATPDTLTLYKKGVSVDKIAVSGFSPMAVKLDKEGAAIAWQRDDLLQIAVSVYEYGGGRLMQRWTWKSNETNSPIKITDLNVDGNFLALSSLPDTHSKIPALNVWNMQLPTPIYQYDPQECKLLSVCVADIKGSAYLVASGAMLYTDKAIREGCIYAFSKL